MTLNRPRWRTVLLCTLGVFLQAWQALAFVSTGTGGVSNLVNCADTSGQHLNFNAATGLFLCGSSTQGAQTVTIPNATPTTIVNVSLGSNTTATVLLSYKAEVFNNVDLQVETGLLACEATNKGGVIANTNCVKTANPATAATAGTLTVTWTITAANPALIQATVTSSLTPASGWPKVTYALLDGTSGIGGAPGNAQADGTTKGLVTFPANDFDCTASGLCSIDWANTQKANGSQPGALSAADWTTFNTKLSTARTLNAGFGMQTIGDLSVDRTISMQAPLADDQVFVSDSSTGATWRTVPNCTDVNGQHLNYNNGTNSWLCGTTSSSASDAQSDGTTKGIAAWNATDFSCTSGVCSLAGTLGGHTFTNTNTYVTKDASFTLQATGDTTKQARFALTSLTTNTTRTFTLPDVSDTLATLVAGQTFSNKVLDNTNSVAMQDALFTLQDDGDATKQAQFQLSALTTGTTRIFTLPNASDTLVCLTCAQTPTNKNLSGATNTFTNLPETAFLFTDVPTGNASTSAHGLMQKYPGGTTNFLRADGTWQPLTGGGNVSNVGTPASGQAAEWTGATTIQAVAVTGTGSYVKATAPTLSAPVGLVKGDVGLGNVDNTSDAAKNSAVATLTNKTISGVSNTLTNVPACATCTTNVSPLTANLPVIGNGSNAISLGTRSGNTTAFVTLAGAATSGTCAQFDASGNVASTGFACGAGSGGSVTSVFGRTGVVIATSGDYTEAQISFTDITTNNASLTAHGYLQKLPGGTTTFLRADGTFATPAGGGNVSNTGTPTGGQAAEWTSSTVIQGVAVTGTGSYVKGTAPNITSPTGLVKGDVGLGNVDNTSDATKNSASVTLTNKTMSGAANTFTNIPLATAVTGNLPVTNLNSGINANSGSFLRGDGTWQSITAIAVTAVGSCGTGPCFTVGSPSASLVFNNATSGTVTLQTVSGALGSSILSLPAITGTLATLAGTETHTNKTLDNSNIVTLRDDRFTLQDDVSPTKQAQFQLSGITAGQTRVFTLPDFNATLATLAGTETLANKTLLNAVTSGPFTAATLLGGSSVTSALTLQSTSAVGTTDSVLVKGGNNGGTTLATFLGTGEVGIGAAPTTGIRFQVTGASAEVRTTGTATTQTLMHTFYDNNATLEGRVVYAGANTAGTRYMGLINDNADYLALYGVNNTPMLFLTNGVEKLRIGANALLSFGPSGAVANPSFQVDGTAGSAASGVKVTAGATGTAPILATISSGTNEGLQIDAKGSGDISFHLASTGNLLLGGNSARIFGENRHTTANTAGNVFDIRAGGATAGATDKDGGSLILRPGQQTGTGRAFAYVDGYVSANSTGTSDGIQLHRAQFGGYKQLTNNSAVNITNLTLASNTVASALLVYGVEVFDGTDLQVETGLVHCHGVNKGGTIAAGTARCTKVGNDQDVSSGTLTVTWTVTNANPAVVQINSNSSLTPATGYPKLNYALLNTTSQQFAAQ